MKQRLAIILGVIAFGLTISACAYRPLKAPCAPDEAGQPLAYAASSTMPEPFASIDSCGPMRPI
jgi:hypothetical protein